MALGVVAWLEAVKAGQLRVPEAALNQALTALQLDGVQYRSCTCTATGVKIVVERSVLGVGVPVAVDLAVRAIELNASVLLKATKVNIPAQNAELRLPAGPLWRVDNALVVDDDVWMWSSSWFPMELLRDPKRTWSPISGLYGQLNDAIGELVPMWRAFSAEAASAEDAEILGIKAGTPLIVRDGLTADQDGNPVLRVSRRARMDRVSYVLRY